MGEWSRCGMTGNSSSVAYPPLRRRRAAVGVRSVELRGNASRSREEIADMREEIGGDGDEYRRDSFHFGQRPKYLCGKNGIFSSPIMGFLFAGASLPQGMNRSLVRHGLKWVVRVRLGPERDVTRSQRHVFARNQRGISHFRCR